MEMTEALRWLDIGHQINDEAIRQGVDLVALPGEPDLDDLKLDPRDEANTLLGRYVRHFGVMPFGPLATEVIQ